MCPKAPHRVSCDCHHGCEKGKSHRVWGHGELWCWLGWAGSEGTSKGTRPSKEKSRQRSPKELHKMTERSCFPTEPIYARALLAWLCQQVWKLLIEAQLQRPNFSVDQASERARTLWCIISSAGPTRLGCVFHLKLSYSNPIPPEQTNNPTSEQTTPWEGWLVRAQQGAERGGDRLAPSTSAGVVFPDDFHPVCHCYQGFANSKKTSGLV